MRERTLFSVSGIALCIGLTSGALLAAADTSSNLSEERAALELCPAESLAPEPHQVVIQGFPGSPNLPIETAWCVRWEEFGHKGLQIVEAWFKRTADEQWMQVLGYSGPVEIFVPYHTGDLRLYDLQFGHLKEARLVDAGPFGTLLGQSKPVVIKEVRDRGIAWKSDYEVRRGEELVLWATYEAGNYEYIMQYGFRDDGTITFRVGATGYNHSDPVRTFEGHTHTVLWRIDPEFGAPDGGEEARLTHHYEVTTDPAAVDYFESIDYEKGEDWNPRQFDALRIVTRGRNAHDHNPGYELVHSRTGTSRHVEPFSHFDFMVTAAKADEVHPEAWQVPGFANGESLQSKDLVIWATSSSHHDPSGEDQKATLVKWSGFDWEPHDLFETTPLFPSCKSSELSTSFLKNYQVVTKVTPQTTDRMYAVSSCPPGKVLLGGGTRIFGPLTGSALTLSTGFPVSGPGIWRHAARQIIPNSSGRRWSLITTAICGNISKRQTFGYFNPPGPTPFGASAQCPYGTAVLGGGGASSDGLTTLASSGPFCPTTFSADARKIPASSDSARTESVLVICGNVPGYEVVTSNSEITDTDSLTQATMCPLGKVALGGGATIIGDATNVALFGSNPVNRIREGDGWSGQAYRLQPGGGHWGLKVDVICATPTP